MPLSGKAMLLASALGVATALAGCGSSSGRLLSRPAATQLSAELTQAKNALANYDCSAADTAIAEFHHDVGQLQGVDATLVTMLSQGAGTISTLADRRCPQNTTPTTTTPTVTRTTRTTRSTTTTTAPTTTTSQSPTVTTTTSSGSGGAAPTTLSTPATSSTPTTVTQPPSSGGAGLSETGGSGGSGSAGSGG
ncbi:MAG TPA: hypothetical protein VFN48_02525 [Solirubrobacteraceae bacterium]|nr:hypothetical protein [Solirubrobacteraceae bacterium]